jgi:hypothetical protein
MTKRTPEGVTADDVLVYAKRVIADFGWQRGAYPEHGPRPHCVRSALYCAAADLEAVASAAHADAIRRVSEALHGRGSIGGINDYEYRKSTNKDTVIALLQKAIEMGPWPAEEQNSGVWPT